MKVGSVWCVLWSMLIMSVWCLSHKELYEIGSESYAIIIIDKSMPNYYPQLKKLYDTYEGIFTPQDTESHTSQSYYYWDIHNDHIKYSCVVPHYVHTDVPSYTKEELTQDPIPFIFKTGDSCLYKVLS
eukprot:TRINITY_DN5246_c0_g1_i3.p1 TRINITY_DN5246_c0_g1~~TRINITY_DN5246_c0_g1_i3.p1  ORF type:complete len:128 (+),score=14.39 TRINITY_DN5246_c0_g1_i3:188-571(+)